MMTCIVVGNILILVCYVGYELLRILKQKKRFREEIEYAKKYGVKALDERRKKK